MDELVDRTRISPSLGAPMATGLGRARALGALQAIGASSVGLARADSVTNEVWMTDDLVVRINRDASHRLHREAVLSQVLPPEVGYPPLIQHGGDVGDDWLVVRRLPGVPLSRAWPTLSTDERRAAVRKIASRLRAVHQTPCPRLDGLHDAPQLLDPAPSGSQAVQRLLNAIARAGQLPNVDPSLFDDAADLVRSTADALDPFDAGTIVHGDLTFENIMWNGSEVTALLDFEYARPGPPDLDLDVLMRFCALPHLHVAPDYEHLTKAEDYAEVPWWFAEEYPELFSHPRQLDRVRLYSIAWDVREILEFPPQESLTRLHKHHPYQRLSQALRGTHYLDRFNGEASVHY
ncbi:phosphotransferase family protein [Aquihabitans sp. McL0605]|uniref:phosphotransferase family protein n=1 Tax=Aquihabitans sp. McL0605 TaxID=3415671 RepID=UPI003CEF8363